MADTQTVPDQIGQIMALMRDKLGVRAPDLSHALAKARHRLPRRVYRDGVTLARAEPLAAHPKLARTLDLAALEQAATGLRAHLEAVDIADRRKGWWLGLLGGLSFNLIAFAALLVAVLVWRGFL